VTGRLQPPWRHHLFKEASRPRRQEAGAPENLTTRVTEAIRQSIVDAEFALGEALSESTWRRGWASAHAGCARR